MPGHTEQDFETAIEAGLVGAGGYEKRQANAYDETLALFPDDVTGQLAIPAEPKAAENATLTGVAEE
jgi:type I restriction enzyme R subunit